MDMTVHGVAESDTQHSLACLFVFEVELPYLSAEGSGAGGVQTAKASRKQSSLSGKESAQGCLPKRLLGRPD